MKIPNIKVEFEEAKQGYWDGGAKKRGFFTPNVIGTNEFGMDYVKDKFEPKGIIKWECYHLNFWFETKAGRSWKEAASIAKRKLNKILGVPAKISVLWGE